MLESRFELQLYLDQQMPPVLLQQFLVELLQQMRREILREILYPLALDFTSQRSISTASSQCQLALGVSTEAQPLVPRHASHKRPNEECAKTGSSGLTKSQELPTQGPQDPQHCTKAAHQVHARKPCCDLSLSSSQNGCGNGVAKNLFCSSHTK